MRRFLLCLLLLPLATPSLAQVPVAITLQASDGNYYGAGQGGFYSYDPTNGVQTFLNTTATELTICLERSDGTLLGIAAGGAASYQAVDITLAGVIKTIASFPASATYEPTCPSLANDGNYYGTAAYNGDYGYGFIYQLTAAGQINVFYNFTGGSDGVGSVFPPLQGSDGNLYWYTNATLQRYSTTSGLTPFPLGDYGGTGPIVEASDGNFYAGGSGVLKITPQGVLTVLYAPAPQDGGNEYGSISNVYLNGSASYPLAVLTDYTYTNSDPNDNCSATGNYYVMQTQMSLAGTFSGSGFDIGGDGYDSVDGLADSTIFNADLLLAGNGNFYYSFVETYQTDDGEYDDCYDYVSSPAAYGTYATGTTPMQMTFNPLQIRAGTTSTLTWNAANAYSDTMKQCFAYGNASGFSGKVASSGSATVTAPSVGSYTAALVCGGTQAGFATLSASQATLALTTSAAKVTVGADVTLTATIANGYTVEPTGKVSFLVGSTLLGTGTFSGYAAYFTASSAGVPPGTYSVVATYPGDANYAAVTSSPVNITVAARAPTTTALTPASQSVEQGASITVTATVTGNALQGWPAGNVKFLQGSTVLGTEPTNEKNDLTSIAVLTASTTSIPPGTYSITARYGGSGNDFPSTASAATVTVTAIPTSTVSLAISPNPVPAGSTFTLTATITGKDSPSGTVSFYANGTQDLASANVTNGTGQATLPAGTLAAGTYPVTAEYAGDANNPKGTSAAVSLTVQ